MAKGKVGRIAVIGAAIAGVIFFWRKRKHQDASSAASSSTIDYGAVTGTPAAESSATPTAE
jgi:hypothetical protein